MADAIIDAARLRELIDYDPETGIFMRKLSVSWRHRPGTRADVVQPRGRAEGYYYARVDGRRYSAHRLAWLYVYGEWPKHQIDHIDGNPGNNRIANLRDVTASMNQQNHKRVPKKSKSGFIGVSLKRGRWMAALTFDGKQIYLGYYDKPEDAHQAYLEGKRKYHAGCTF